MPLTENTVNQVILFYERSLSSLLFNSIFHWFNRSHFTVTLSDYLFFYLDIEVNKKKNQFELEDTQLRSLMLCNSGCMHQMPPVNQCLQIFKRVNIVSRISHTKTTGSGSTHTQREIESETHTHTHTNVLPYMSVYVYVCEIQQWNVVWGNIKLNGTVTVHN